MGEYLQELFEGRCERCYCRFNEATGKETLLKAQEIDRDRVDFIKIDVASESDIENMFEFAVERFGRIDVVFNNAGVGGAVGPLTETSVESCDTRWT